MAIPQQYGVTTPYGYVKGYPLNDGFHKGVDYGCPEGTPVVVNGWVIGYSGQTGAAFGAHLHVGRFVNGNPTNPGFGGFDLANARVLDVGYDDGNGKFVRVSGDNVVWVYCHLSRIIVNNGQALPVVGGRGAEGAPNMNNSDKIAELRLNRLRSLEKMVGVDINLNEDQAYDLAGTAITGLKQNEQRNGDIAGIRLNYLSNIATAVNVSTANKSEQQVTEAIINELHATQRALRDNQQALAKLTDNQQVEAEQTGMLKKILSFFKIG